MTRSRTHFVPLLWGLLLVGLVCRVGYVIAQAATDPAFARPGLDGAIYLDWARQLVTGGRSPSGVFYLAPLYPHALWLFIETFGEDFALLYYLQQAGMVGAAGLLALVGRRVAGETTALAAAVLFLLYHPIVFFASRPVGEPLAILLLVASLYLVGGPGRLWGGAGGLLCGIAALARPNLLLIPPVWAASDLLRGRGVRALCIAAGLALAVVPTTVRNFRESGHLVPISSNAGMTLYHANGPGARPFGARRGGFTDRPDIQQTEAIRLASLLAGREIADGVEADRILARQAIRERIGHPAATLRLVWQRVVLLVSNEELSEGLSPSIDRNPLRWVAPVPFALLFALAAAGVFLRGSVGTGGSIVWGAILACALVPVVFYPSTRYRLPMGALLALPAAVGLVALLSGGGSGLLRSRRAGLGLAAGVASVSILIPIHVPFVLREKRDTEVQALTNRSIAWRHVGNVLAAEDDLKRALDRDAASVPALFTQGVLLERIGRPIEARESYERAHAVEPGNADVAGNLGRLLKRQGRVDEALAVLRRGLASDPTHWVCWTQLIRSLTLAGEFSEARAAAGRALELGVDLEEGVLQEIEKMRQGGTETGHGETDVE